MKNLLIWSAVMFSTLCFGQAKKIQKKPAAKTVRTGIKTAKPAPDLAKLNDAIPALIPFKQEGKFGFRNQKGRVIIAPQFSNVGFFTADCNLQNSPNEKVRKYGNEDFASVRTTDGRDYRIDVSGKKVYTFKDSDLGKCPSEFKQQLYHAYTRNGFYGIIRDEDFKNEQDYRHYKIYPQYQYLHILEGKNLESPMIIAAINDRFGVIDVNNKVIIPFEYADIKPNFSWYLANLFEVSKDGKNYFFVDEKNKAY